MRHLIFLFLFLLIISCTNKNPTVSIQTELGEIIVEIYLDDAPVTSANFLNHVADGDYINAMFYRVVNDDNQTNSKVKIDVIQGGLFHDSLVDAISPIIHETTLETGIKHENGTISMARLEPGTASTEFFICIGDQPELDYQGKRNPDKMGFAAFGKVIKGMEIVREIHHLPNENQYLRTPLVISDISIENHSN